MSARRNAKVLSTVELSELRTVSELQTGLMNIFPSRGSLEWELRINRAEYLKGGALFEIRGRLMAHPATFQRIALEIAARRVAAR